MGPWVFVLAYATAVAGSYTGLSCIRRSHEDSGRNGGNWWLPMASLAIGGVGIWLMHFIGMMGFTVPGTVIRYHLGPTVLSVLAAVVTTMLGIWIVTVRSAILERLPRGVRPGIGGLVMGLAVTLMHYIGMTAMRVQGTIDHDARFVLLSVGIGVVASTLALALARSAERVHIRLMAAFVMASAVVALHYTGMAGVHVVVDPEAPEPSGMSVLSFLFPAFILGIIVLAVPITALVLAPGDEKGRHGDLIDLRTDAGNGT